MDLMFLYLIFINANTFLLYGLDKWKAKKGKRRISERTLLLLAAIGGTLGAGVGMAFFHHKTKKPKFYIGVPTLLILQIIICICLIHYF